MGPIVKWRRQIIIINYDNSMRYHGEERREKGGVHYKIRSQRSLI